MTALFYKTWTDTNTVVLTGNTLLPNTTQIFTTSGSGYAAIPQPWYPGPGEGQTPYVDGIACCDDCDDAIEADHFRITLQDSVYRLTRVGSTRAFERCPYCGYRQ